MFDSNGQVIGLVSLKADIEGAGFALPASDSGVREIGESIALSRAAKSLGSVDAFVIRQEFS